MTVLYVEEWRDIVHLETTYQSLLLPRNIRVTTSGLCYKRSSLLAALVESFPYKSLAITRHSIWQWIQVGGSLFVGSSFFIPTRMAEGIRGWVCAKFTCGLDSIL